MMYGRGSTPGNRPPSPAIPVPISTALSHPAIRASKPFANKSKVSGPGSRKNTQIQIGQCANRYSAVLRARIFRSLANSTGIPRLSLGTASNVISTSHL